MEADRVFALSVHASYACRHSGACCTAGWTIPVEAHLLPLVGAEWLEPDASGACPQYEPTSGLCRIHRDHGEAMLPQSCHHFPRRALTDERGTFVTLSHFCPTAAALLLDGTEPLRIVSQPSAFSPARGYEGLDARNEWPPLLRPDVLFDADSFSQWERWLVETLGNSRGAVGEALALIAAAAERLRKWNVSDGTLAAWTGRVLAERDLAADHESALRYAEYSGPDAYQRVSGAVPSGLTAPSLPADLARHDARWVAPEWNSFSGSVLRYLGVRAFASWTAYQSRGIRTQVAELVVTCAVLRIECVRACAAAMRPLDRETLLEAIRGTDLLLVHLVERDRLLPWLGKAETHAVPASR